MWWLRLGKDCFVPHNLLRIQDSPYSIPLAFNPRAYRPWNVSHSADFSVDSFLIWDSCGNFSQIRRGLVIYVCFFKGADTELLPKMGMCCFSSHSKRGMRMLYWNSVQHWCRTNKGTKIEPLVSKWTKIYKNHAVMVSVGFWFVFKALGLNLYMLSKCSTVTYNLI